MGLNQDLFGCQDYCIQPSDVSPAIVVKRISEVLARRESLKEQLAEKMPKIRESAMCGGTILRRLISSERGDMC
jgi:hypothetical protein